MIDSFANIRKRSTFLYEKSIDPGWGSIRFYSVKLSTSESYDIANLGIEDVFHELSDTPFKIFNRVLTWREAIKNE